MKNTLHSTNFDQFNVKAEKIWGQITIREQKRVQESVMQLSAAASTFAS